MDLIISFIAFLFNAIVAIFTNAWLFVIVFLILGIVAVKQKSNGAGFACIILAFIVFVNAIL